MQEHKVAQPAEERITDDAVAWTGSESRTLHDVTDEHGGNQVLAALQSGDRNLSNLLGRLRLIRLLEHLRQLRLDLLLVVESRTQNTHRENRVNLDIGSRRGVTVASSEGTVVHFDLLTEGIRQGANSSLGGRIRPVASDGHKSKSGASENEVPTGVSHLTTGIHWGKPVSKGSMGHVGSGPVDSVHLLTLNIDGYIGKEAWMAEPSTTPDDVRSHTIVPGSDFCDNSVTLSGNREISTDVEKTLLERVQCFGLSKMLATAS